MDKKPRNAMRVPPASTRLPLLTLDEVGAVLRKSRTAVYAMIERGKLPGIVRLGRRVLIREADLLDFLDRNTAPSPER